MSFRVFIIYHSPAIIYAAAVVVVSSIPNLSPPVKEFLLADKLFHTIEYAFFAYLTFRSLRKLFSGNFKQSIFMTGIILTVFAFLDELYQNLIPGRFCDTLDFIFDVAGVILVLFLLYWKCKSVYNSKLRPG